MGREIMAPWVAAIRAAPRRQILMPKACAVPLLSAAVDIRHGCHRTRDCVTCDA